MIPDLIHQYWHSKELPAEASLKALRFHNGARKARLWSRESAADYIRQRYGDALVEVFNCCRIPAMQSDFFRYCILLEEGGIYLDSDAMLHMPFEIWVDDNADIVLPITKIHDSEKLGLGNGFIVSRAQNPILAFALGQCVYNVARQTENNVARVTGPRTLHCAIRFRRHLNLQLVDPRDKYLDNFRLVVRDNSTHWSQRQECESIFADAPDSLARASDFLCSIPWPRGLIADCISSEVRETIELGFRYAEFEYQLLHRGVSRELLEILLYSELGFDFSALRDYEQRQGAELFHEYDGRIRRWRVGLCRREVERFDRNLESLVSAIVAADEIPDEDYPLQDCSPGLCHQAALRLESLGHEHMAIRVIRKSVDAIDYERDIFVTAVRLFRKGGLYRDAERCALEVLRWDEGNASATHCLARACEHLGQLDSALLHAERFLSLKKRPDCFRTTLGLFLS